MQAFYRQQPQMLAYAQKLMDEAKLSWQDGVRQFLHNVCYGGQSRFAIMNVEEQQALFKCLSGENRQAFQERRLTFLTELLSIFGIHAGTQEIKLIGNLAFSVAILHRAIPDDLPFFFSDVADEMTSFQIDTVLNYMETLRRQ